MDAYGRDAEFYDAIYHWKNYDREAERSRELLSAEGVAPGSLVLEAGCGTGAHLSRLRAWYRVSGFDLNESMLAQARRKLPELPLFKADMADFSVSEPVDALLCLFSSIGYVYPEPRLRSAARAFARAVRPGGILIVEPWFTEAKYRTGELVLNTYESDELKLCRASVAKRDGELSVLDFHWLVLRRDAPEVEHFVARHTLWLCPTETLLKAFSDAGFSCRFEPEGLRHDRGLILGRRRS